MMLRVSALTFRIHRAELVLSAAIVSLVAGAIAVVIFRLTNASSPDAFDSIRADEASWLLGAGAAIFPVIVGLIMGVPIVGRELEMRTTALAWSLSPDRKRWLAHRLLPMLVLLLVGLGTVAILELLLLHATSPGALYPRIDHLGAQGISFVARGVMAFGIATLAGALLARTLPAFLVAAFLALALALVGSTALTAVLAQQMAVWRETGDTDRPLLRLREMYLTSDDRWLNWEEVMTWYEEQPPGTDWERWEAEHITRMELIVPLERYGDFERAETAAGLLIGSFGLLLTFPVVARRRPG